jgi:hypothetical protein
LGGDGGDVAGYRRSGGGGVRTWARGQRGEKRRRRSNVADEEERPRRSDVINEITVQIELRDGGAMSAWVAGGRRIKASKERAAAAQLHISGKVVVLL